MRPAAHCNAALYCKGHLNATRCCLQTPTAYGESAGSLVGAAVGVAAFRRKQFEVVLSSSSDAELQQNSHASKAVINILVSVQGIQLRRDGLSAVTVVVHGAACLVWRQASQPQAFCQMVSGRRHLAPQTAAPCQPSAALQHARMQSV